MAGGCGGCLLAIVLLVFLLFAAQFVYYHAMDWWTTSPKTLVHYGDFGEAWPLTVLNGAVYSRKAEFGRDVIFQSPDGQQYGLNGTAISHGYPDIHQITQCTTNLGDPVYRDVSCLIDLALRHTTR